MQKNLTIDDYINILASEKAIPGGGSAAALVSAIGNALCGMVFSLTVNKKSYLSESDEIKQKIKKAQADSNEVTELLLKSMDDDGEAFAQILESFKLPKDTEENKKVREQKIQESYRSSLTIPLELAEKSMNLYNHIYVSCKHGNKNLISDAGVAAILINAAIESAILNVKVNLVGIKDNNYKNNILNRINDILIKNDDKKNKIMSMVSEEIGI
ncbi:cyclodeaminase/cyclohydrolase family protein [Clostridium sediminicola]|uniref:cyclodeaminase/cyclohydrolase family protein n=1 Tax=Clostridium sediminicola TaxID=3114879 RepID=UPI0031F24968